MSPFSPSKHVSDSELQIGAVPRSHLDLEEQPGVMLQATDEVQSAARIRPLVLVEVVVVDRGPAAAVHGPGAVAQRDLVYRLDVHGDERHVVADADLEIGA